MGKQNKFVLVTGLMSSGKSTLMREYALNFEVIDFTEPPIKVQFNGLDFQFIDATFAIDSAANVVNFYELDAPTIRKWYQFVEVADAVMIVYNHNPAVTYGTHGQLKDAIYQTLDDSKPIFFVLNNFHDRKKVEEDIKLDYDFEGFPDKNFILLEMPKGENFFDQTYGRRV